MLNIISLAPGISKPYRSFFSNNLPRRNIKKITLSKITKLLLYSNNSVRAVLMAVVDMIMRGRCDWSQAVLGIRGARLVRKDAPYVRETVCRSLKILQEMNLIQKRYRHEQTSIYGLHPALLTKKFLRFFKEYWPEMYKLLTLVIRAFRSQITHYYIKSLYYCFKAFYCSLYDPTRVSYRPPSPGDSGDDDEFWAEARHRQMYSDPTPKKKKGRVIISRSKVMNVSQVYEKLKLSPEQVTALQKYPQEVVLKAGLRTIQKQAREPFTYMNKICLLEQARRTPNRTRTPEPESPKEVKVFTGRLRPQPWMSLGIQENIDRWEEWCNSPDAQEWYDYYRTNREIEQHRFMVRLKKLYPEFEYE